MNKPLYIFLKIRPKFAKKAWTKKEEAWTNSFTSFESLVKICKNARTNPFTSFESLVKICKKAWIIITLFFENEFLNLVQIAEKRKIPIYCLYFFNLR